MNNQYIVADSIHLRHKNNAGSSNIQIISESAIEVRVPVHCNQFIINNMFKIIESSDSLIIQKKVDGVFTNYFLLT